MVRQLLLISLCSALWAQEPEKLTIPFSDPSRPGTLKVNLVQGGITVKAYNGKEVVVQARARNEEGGSTPAAARGMKRIPMTSSGLEGEEDNNVISLGVGSRMRPIDLDIQVPVRTSLKLRTVNGGNITVEGVQGEIEAHDTNGAVTLQNVAGSAVAHALNGKVLAVFTAVDPQKPMAFSSLNGDIDVTFPADLKANVKMKSDHGEVYSDFDVTVRPAAQPLVEQGGGGKGRYRVSTDRYVYGSINGGGPEIQLNTFNGSIYIHKAK